MTIKAMGKQPRIAKIDLLRGRDVGIQPEAKSRKPLSAIDEIQRVRAGPKPLKKGHSDASKI
jgi:hypothetical protein